MKETTVTKLIEAVSTPAAQVVQEVVEKTGKTSAITGGVVYGVEQAVDGSWTMAEYAAMVSIAGGLVWIAKMLFEMWVTWLKHRQGR